MDILVLVCALGVAASDCQPETSVDTFHGPGPQANLAGCMREGLLFAAQSGLVVKGTYPKIACIPPEARRTLVTRREWVRGE
jgi:hypothetical protein